MHLLDDLSEVGYLDGKYFRRPTLFGSELEICRDGRRSGVEQVLDVPESNFDFSHDASFLLLNPFLA
jgi:hypothetical protein